MRDIAHGPSYTYITEAWTMALFSTRLYLVNMACLVDRARGKSAASRPQTLHPKLAHRTTWDRPSLGDRG